ncbi:hypothetical protein D3C85_1251090 [compost metagenome]
MASLSAPRATDLPVPGSPATISVNFVCRLLASFTGKGLPSGVANTMLASSAHGVAGRCRGSNASAADRGGYISDGILSAFAPTSVDVQARIGSPNVPVTSHTPQDWSPF